MAKTAKTPAVKTTKAVTGTTHLGSPCTGAEDALCAPPFTTRGGVTFKKQPGSPFTCKFCKKEIAPEDVKFLVEPFSEEYPDGWTIDYLPQDDEYEPFVVSNLELGEGFGTTTAEEAREVMAQQKKARGKK